MNELTDFIKKFDNIYVETNEIKRKNIYNQMAQLKAQQVNLMRELKKITDVRYFTEEQLNKEVEDIRKCWIEAIKRQHYKTHFNLAVTLNFNNEKLSYPLNIQSVQNRLDEWWKLFCSYHLGRNARNYSQMSYIGFIEHPNTNIHIHLAVHTNENIIDTDDSYVYDEEQIIKTLWKCVQSSGSVYVESITDNKWFYYITKERGFENRLVSSPNIFDK